MDLRNRVYSALYWALSKVQRSKVHVANHFHIHHKFIVAIFWSSDAENAVLSQNPPMKPRLNTQWWWVHMYYNYHFHTSKPGLGAFSENYRRSQYLNKYSGGYTIIYHLWRRKVQYFILILKDTFLDFSKGISINFFWTRYAFFVTTLAGGQPRSSNEKNAQDQKNKKSRYNNAASSYHIVGRTQFSRKLSR